MTDLSPTPLTDERLAELSAALFGYCVGGCGCMTKTPEASQHLPTCLYRVCWESAVFIAQARRSLAERDARIAELEDEKLVLIGVKEAWAADCAAAEARNAALVRVLTSIRDSTFKSAVTLRALADRALTEQRENHRCQVCGNYDCKEHQ